MTPEQKIKHAILVCEAELSGRVGQDITEQSVDRLYDELVAIGEHWDAVSEIREGEVETEIPCPPSRHYEAKSVAMRAPDGSWVGWTYWGLVNVMMRLKWFPRSQGSTMTRTSVRFRRSTVKNSVREF